VRKNKFNVFYYITINRSKFTFEVVDYGVALSGL